MNQAPDAGHPRRAGEGADSRRPAARDRSDGAQHDRRLATAGLPAPLGHPDLPSPRVCWLLQRLFDRCERWPVSLTADDLPHLFRGSDEPGVANLAARPVAIRKAMAVRRLLETVSSVGAKSLGA